LRESGEAIEKWKKPWSPVEPPSRPGLTIHGENGNKWYRNFVDGTEKYKTVQPRIEALMRSAALAMAAERFRLDKGTWPAALEELAPLYIKEIPPDPYANGPLRMVRKKDSIVIYSVWKDGKDDGGELDRTFGRQEGTDYGFQLWDPSARVAGPAE
jgi:hypothetical protein